MLTITSQDASQRLSETLYQRSRQSLNGGIPVRYLSLSILVLVLVEFISVPVFGYGCRNKVDEEVSCVVLTKNPFAQIDHGEGSIILVRSQ